jgi:hypothetical protein
MKIMFDLSFSFNSVQVQILLGSTNLSDISSYVFNYYLSPNSDLQHFLPGEEKAMTKSKNP